MSDIPNDLYYSKDHEWVAVEDNVATIGITDHAQSELGDITFVELPDDEIDVNAGDEVANIESVKAASPVYAPVGGTVSEANAELEDEPGAVNNDPYGAGWIFRVEMSDASELESLMNADDYEQYLADEAGESD